MRARALALATTAGATLAFGTTAAGAASGPPPPPTAPGGQQVTQLAANLQTPTSFAKGGGALFEGDGGSESSKIPNGGVYVIKGGTATKLAGSFKFVSGLAWHKGSLYVAGGSISKQGISWQVQRWTGFNGTKFAKEKAIWTGPKGFDGTNGIAFSPSGRLFLGVDVGLTDNNDHGPANKTPLLYKIISMRANGSGVQVYASGIRQPWQMVFPKGSPYPLVSDLGQNGPKGFTAPDAILKVKPGDDYGFPKCALIPKSKACTGASKAWRLFAPHTDIMGLAIVGKRLYMTSFAGPGGKGRGGEVLSMPLKGGKVTPFVTGFVAPTVGLGTDGHSLYIGELTGQAFKVTP